METNGTQQSPRPQCRNDESLNFDMDEDVIRIGEASMNLYTLDTECECGAMMDPDQEECIECGMPNPFMELGVI